MPVVTPTSLADAVAAFAVTPGAVALAGGTDLMVEVNEGRRAVRGDETVIALGRVPELTSYTVDAAARRVTLGAAVRWAQIEREPLRGLLPALAEAKALLLWHARHRFCSVCGQPSRLDQAGWRRSCPACGAEHFPRTDPVVIMLTADGDRCLLGRQARFAPGMWSCLAGFVEPGEAIEEAVRRETFEEAGVRCGPVRYVGSQPWPFPMSLMIGCIAEALNTDLVIDRTELEDLRWFSRDEVAAMLAGRHPDGLTAPPPIAIANFIIRGWVDETWTGLGRAEPA